VVKAVYYLGIRGLARVSTFVPSGMLPPRAEFLLTHKSVLPARSMEDPLGSIDPIVVQGPLIDAALA
jgi:hypothetical protein